MPVSAGCAAGWRWPAWAPAACSRSISGSNSADHRHHRFDAASRDGQGPGTTNGSRQATAASGGTVRHHHTAFDHLHRLRLPDEPVDQRPVRGRPAAGSVDGHRHQFACWYLSRKNKWGKLISIDPVRIIRTAFGAWLGFFAILLVIWGIYSGKFSPTEAAGVTAGSV